MIGPWAFWLGVVVVGRGEGRAEVVLERRTRDLESGECLGSQRDGGGGGAREIAHRIPAVVMARVGGTRWQDEAWPKFQEEQFRLCCGGADSHALEATSNSHSGRQGGDQREE